MVYNSLYFISVFKEVLSWDVLTKPYREMTWKPEHRIQYVKVIFVESLTFLITASIYHYIFCNVLLT